jgi:hypothetical protein
MDEETLELIKQKYELSVINAKEAERIRTEKARQLELADFELRDAKAALSRAIDSVNLNRREYETALYKFWEINNE